MLYYGPHALKTDTGFQAPASPAQAPWTLLLYFLPRGSGWGKGLLLPDQEEPVPSLFEFIPPLLVASWPRSSLGEPDLRIWPWDLGTNTLSPIFQLSCSSLWWWQLCFWWPFSQNAVQAPSLGWGCTGQDEKPETVQDLPPIASSPLCSQKKLSLRSSALSRGTLSPSLQTSLAGSLRRKEWKDSGTEIFVFPALGEVHMWVCKLTPQSHGPVRMLPSFTFRSH